MVSKNEAHAEAIPSRPQILHDSLNVMDHPNDIDEATDRLGISPLLINPYLATPIDLSYLGYGMGIHMPVQISKKEGGRESLYFLRPGKKVLAGVLVAGTVLAFRYVSRETGCSMPARGGDEYIEEIRSINGRVLSQLRGRLEVMDAKRGEGRIAFYDGALPGHDGPQGLKIKVSIWYWWSCIYVEGEIQR